MALNPNLSSLSAEERQALEAWLVDFDQQWHNRRLIAQVRELPSAGPLRKTALCELVKIDLERQWQVGRRLRLQEYLKAFPELGTAETAAADLFEAESEVRRQFGAAIDSSDMTDGECLPWQEALETQYSLGLHESATLDTLPPADIKAIHRPADAAWGDVSQPGAFAVPGYVILSELGRGGMGVVYKARHLGLDRVVALKMVLCGGHAGADQLARFRIEAEAVARLQHPNIVQIHDVGDHQGCPYFSLEFVQGGSLAQRLAAAPLAAHEAARLLRSLSGAIEHAHAQGIVHRDLKPANVLLAADGTPKITDFGLAKRLEGDDAQTYSGAVMGTPNYMAPEQAEGRTREIGPSVDVYALGAILYEMLSGRPPFRGVTVLDTLEQVRCQEPVSPSRLQAKVPRDLETIVLKCLRKEPHNRYASAQELSDDLGRFLAGEPIRARPVSRWERTVKWARRRPAAAALIASAVAVPLVTLVGLTAGLLIFAGLNQELEERGLAFEKANTDLQASLDREKGERQRAQENGKTAEERDAETQAVLDFAEKKIFAAARPLGQLGGLGRKVTLREAIEAALPFVQKSFTHQPLIEARLRLTLGVSFRHLGEEKIALEQEEIARRIYTKHRGSDHPDTLKSMNNVANSYGRLGRHAEALKLREETLALRKAKLGHDHPDTLLSMHNLANSYAAFSRHADALKLREETLALRKAKLGPDHPDTLMTMGNLGNSYHELGRHTDALKLREETLALMTAKHGGDHPETLLSMVNLANSYSALDRHADADKLREQTLALQKDKLGPDHRDTLMSMHNLATSYDTLGRHTEALKLDEETLALRTARLGADHPDTLLSRWGVARGLVNLDRGAEALPIIDDCLRRAAGKVVDPRLIPGVMGVRLRHFEKLKDVAGCRATAEMWEKLNRTNPDSLYQAASNRAVTAAVLRATDKSAEAAKKGAAEADRAMAWLRKAVAAGYCNAEHMAKDKDLDVLRDREDFQRLLAELRIAEAKHNK
jgi:tetratricopeptide (TPR) repeat protein